MQITVDGTASLRVRMIDCVGYMIPEAVGQMEGAQPRMVHTPWFDEEVPLSKAAEIGTRKVIREHSTIGLVITTDGSIGEISRESYVEAEERIIAELKEIKKPFSILLNSTSPYGAGAQKLQAELEEKYGVSCRAMNCAAMRASDTEEILSTLLYEFPTKEYSFTVPEWITVLEDDNELKTNLYSSIMDICRRCGKMKDCRGAARELSKLEYIRRADVTGMDLAEGRVSVDVSVPQELFF